MIHKLQSRNFFLFVVFVLGTSTEILGGGVGAAMKGLTIVYIVSVHVGM
jgi:hypothetical protein